jgi:Stress responsive A/B Barrel Domain
MKINNKFFIVVVLLMVSALYIYGHAAEKDTVNMPSTVIHHVTLKWKDGVSDSDKQKALDGLKEIASTTPGVKNIWMKSLKIQPREYSQTFVIEFENDAALKAYADHPKKKEWDDFYYSIRETSLNSVTTN